MQNNIAAIQEDEIDLRALFVTIAKNKITLFVIVFFFTFIALIYALMQPNSYQSKAVFIPLETEKNSNIIPDGLEGFVNLSIGQNSGVYHTYVQLSKSYEFMKKFILHYKLQETFFDTTHFVYPLGLFEGAQTFEAFGEVGETMTLEQEATLFKIYQTISQGLSISEDKKSNLITFSYKGNDRFLNRAILDGFVEFSGSFLKNKEMMSIDNKIESLQDEISQVRDIELKNRMLELSSTLYKRKIFLKTEDFTGLRNIVMPEVPHIKDKTGPKRALILVVSMVTSFIFAIFLIFFKEFIGSFNKLKEDESSK